MGFTGSMEVLGKFRQAASTDRVIRLLNVYKGVPISNDGTIQQIGDKTITLISQKYQIVCLSKYRETYIQSNWLPLTVRARVVKVNFLKNEVTLSDFEYVTSHIGGRALVRVVPKDPVEVFLQNDLLTGKVRTELVDISLQGIGVHLMSELYQARAFEAGRDIMINMDLPYNKSGSSKTLRTQGTVIHSEPAGWFRGHRIGIMLFPTKEAKSLLSEYIRQRQTEIFNEIKIQYDLMARLAKREQESS